MSPLLREALAEEVSFSPFVERPFYELFLRGSKMQDMPVKRISCALESQGSGHFNPTVRQVQRNLSIF